MATLIQGDTKHGFGIDTVLCGIKTVSAKAGSNHRQYQGRWHRVVALPRCATESPPKITANNFVYKVHEEDTKACSFV